MDYSRIYNQLIERGQDRQKGLHRKDLVILLGHVERHHIKPRSLGGIDSPENLTPDDFIITNDKLYANGWTYDEFVKEFKKIYRPYDPV